MTELVQGPTGSGVGVVRAFPMRRGGCPFDVPAEYGTLRSAEPVSRALLRDGSTVWLVARHADVQAGLVDERISCDGSTPGIPMPGGSGVDPVGRRSSFVRMDPPEHDVHRKLLAPDFTMRKARALRPWIQGVVDSALDDLAGSGQPADLVRLLAMPVPSTVVCHVLGVPHSDHEFFQSRAAVMLDRGSSRDDLRNAVVELRTYMIGLLQDKRANPGDDVLTKLAHAPADLGLTDDDLAGAAQSVLNASHEATVNMIALGTLALTENPHALAELKADRNLWPAAVDELLRYLGIGDLLSPRIAKEDLDIAGQRIAAGEGLYFLTGSANRDEEVYADPAAFDLHRPHRGHLAFGYGLHQCLGQNLARVELEVVFESLFRRFPDLRPAVPVDELSYKHDSALFGVHELPVVW
ncbi:cytochrome P450 [Saccharothrix variisporea]|uniref:Pentalenic acid synthase n=1 Tax=Saccharothrix variisporea TaxID=543527 RepID=A0A495XQ32_9PSEU|nr:cytochrome P450 [Saccharothrix variisporea]RKT75024.1 pentalenic acid synthase [Saccharothrix variisporea]